MLSYVESCLNVLEAGKKIYLDFISPIHCQICNSQCGDNQIIFRLCNQCFYSLDYSPDKEHLLNSLYSKKKGDDSALNSISSYVELTSESNVELLIYALKYDYCSRIGFDFGKVLGKKILNDSTYTDIDLIIPVPLHTARIRERTYNQSLYIAKGIQEITHKRIENTCLQRIMYSGSQTLLNVSERSSNRSDTIFKVNNKDRIHHASILLVDDIFTTGATLEACANTLLLEGASCVHGITIASAPLR